MFHYFGFGSNMDLTSLRAKGVEPAESRRAVLHGWRLRFNVQHFFRHEGGMGNIEPAADPEARVLGVLHRCPDEALAPLDATEAYGYGYDRITVEVDAGGEAVPAYTYVGMPDFLDARCLPTRRYLNILLSGARHAGLDPRYIAALEAHPVHQPGAYPPFEPPPGEHPRFDAESLAAHPLYTALYGAVFDMAWARPRHEFLKGFFGGRDMTLFHLKRLDTSDGNETLDDIRHDRLDARQREYLNAYLHEYAAEYRYIGRFAYK